MNELKELIIYFKQRKIWFLHSAYLEMARPESAKYRLLENPVMRLGSNWDRYPNINRRLNIKKIVIKKETVLLFFKVLIPFSVRSMLHLIIWWGENLPLLPGIISLMMKTFPCFLRNHQITADVVLAVKDFYISIYFIFFNKKMRVDSDKSHLNSTLYSYIHTEIIG